ncbi:hypothetical protein [Brevibacillus laterosporus]|uniref:hypothetical protein n=1 Tax=Brevibacillus laterosporus TaxID=1465 RepID=UPI003D202DF6
MSRIHTPVIGQAKFGNDNRGIFESHTRSIVRKQRKPAKKKKKSKFIGGKWAVTVYLTTRHNRLSVVKSVSQRLRLQGMKAAHSSFILTAGVVL